MPKPNSVLSILAATAIVHSGCTQTDTLPSGGATIGFPIAVSLPFAIGVIGRADCIPAPSAAKRVLFSSSDTAETSPAVRRVLEAQFPNCAIAMYEIGSTRGEDLCVSCIDARASANVINVAIPARRTSTIMFVCRYAEHGGALGVDAVGLYLVDESRLNLLGAGSPHTISNGIESEWRQGFVSTYSCRNSTEGEKNLIVDCLSLNGHGSGYLAQEIFVASPHGMNTGIAMNKAGLPDELSAWPGVVLVFMVSPREELGAGAAK